MADSGKINTNHDFAKPGSSKPSQPSSDSPAPKTSPKLKTSADIYKGSTNSQSNLLLNQEANTANKKIFLLIRGIPCLQTLANLLNQFGELA